MTSEKKIFLSFSRYKSMETLDFCDGASLYPRGMIGRTCVGNHQTLLHTKHASSGPVGFREEDF